MAKSIDPKKSGESEEKTAVQPRKVVTIALGGQTRRKVKVASAHCDVAPHELAEFALLHLLKTQNPAQLVQLVTIEALDKMRAECEK